VIDDERLRICLEVLEASRTLAPDDPRLRELERATAHLRKSLKRARKKARAAEAATRDRALLQDCGRWREWDAGARQASLPAASDEPASEPRVLHNARRCYVCKNLYRELDAHYHVLCPSCAERNWAARSAGADLRGRRALVTGGRVKIGFELVRMLLRDGASVVVVTRFPRDAARRFAALEEFASFEDRLAIIGLDLRYLPAVIELCDALIAEGRALDILINNAAQTIWRPPAWYAELATAELGLGSSSANSLAAIGGASLATFHQACLRRDEQLFPPGARDEEGRQLDLRADNSWVLGLEQVDAGELVEAQLVNAIAPALLCSRLRPLLDRSPAADRHVVNVSAVEGQFAYANKTPRHPHTNMAKAALNMLTRTCADDWAKARIYVNSVDTGWITQEHPEPTKQRLAAAGFRPPLDLIDGAARIYDPIIRGVEGRAIWGKFLKDYEPADW
jgi:NAD(P)-dependent dehydrogenase (short-subunit alcohol dehydrogenase family)